MPDYHRDPFVVLIYRREGIDPGDAGLAAVQEMARRLVALGYLVGSAGGQELGPKVIDHLEAAVMDQLKRVLDEGWSSSGGEGVT